MRQVIEKYIANNNQKFQRYNSWNHCFEAFDTLKDEELLSLHLGFYLASWGMYRGSGGLLQKDYKIHGTAVEIIKDNWGLRCSDKNEVNHSSIPKIIDVIQQLQNHYKSFEFVTSKGQKRYINPTETLISKILLGTLGCVPAFDRFFIDGVKEEKRNFKTLKKKSLEHLFTFVEANQLEFKNIQKVYPQYPIMKIVDMYFWQIGFDLSTIKTKNGKTKLL